MAWPNPSDYQEALQNPRRAFADVELQGGRVTTNNLGLPRPISGNFATVFEVTSAAGQKWAVRCFSREVSDQQQRYAAIHRHLQAHTLPCIAGFEYLPKGVLVRGQWYPIVKMQWVEGVQLDTFIRQHLNQPEELAALAQKWLALTQSLKATRIAHGDLQHGNILITPQSELKLVDYDGMVVPALASGYSSEIGHRHYQHPSRNTAGQTNAQDYLNLDNFSAWVIGVSLELLSIDPGLWRNGQSGDDNLLFEEVDYKQPSTSALFRILANHPDGRVRTIGAEFMRVVQVSSYLHVPPLRLVTIARPTAKDWLFGSQAGPSTSPEGKSWIQDHLQQAKKSAQAVWRGGTSSWLADYVTALEPLPKAHFSDVFVEQEAQLYLAERESKPLVLRVLFTPRRFVSGRFNTYPLAQEKARVQQNHKAIRAQLAKAKASLIAAQLYYRNARTSTDQVLRFLRSEIDSLTHQLRDLDGKEQAELAAAQRDKERRERMTTQQLAQIYIQPGLIPRIGRVRIEALNRVGIHTAADITQANQRWAIGALQQVHGSDGWSDWQALQAWRKQLEQTYSAPPRLTAAEEYPIRLKYSGMRQELYRKRDTKMAEFRLAEQNLLADPNIQQLEREVQNAQRMVDDLKRKLAQAEQELERYSEITVEQLAKRIRDFLPWL